MRKFVSMLAAGGALLATAGLANAQQTLIDTTANYRTGINNLSGGIIGADPNNGSGAPTTASQAGYAVIPFAVTGTGNWSLTSVSTVINMKSPSSASQTTSNNLWGVFIQAPTGSSINSNSAHEVGSFFQFDTSALTSNGLGTDVNGVVSNLSGSALPTLQAGQSYWLVISPKAGFNSGAAGDTNSNGTVNILDWGVLNTSTKTTGTAGPFATETLGQHESGNNAGANPGDMLVNQNAYYALKLQGNLAAPVPELPSSAGLLMGVVPLGIAFARRRAAK